MVIALLVQIPVSPSEALHVAGAAGRLQVFDFSFSLTNTYTFWSGLIGGTFLMLSYFGTDQSQVQRYLAAKSVNEARTSLLISAYWKIPLQALVLLVGVLVFVFYQYAQAAAALQSGVRARRARGAAGGVQRTLEQRFDASTTPLGRDSIHAEALALASKVTGREAKDVNYIIPRFVLDHLPIGLAGSVHRGGDRGGDERDFRRAQFAVDDDDDRLLPAMDSQPRRRTRTSSWCPGSATGVWGVFACVVATYAVNLGSLIEVVNRFGSFFYGSILGVFLLAMIPRGRRDGRVRRTDRRHGDRGRGELRRADGVVSLAQRDWRGDGRRRWDARSARQRWTGDAEPSSGSCEAASRNGCEPAARLYVSE